MLILCVGYVRSQAYRIGDLYTAPDGSQGIVFYLHPDGSSGWVVALNDASEGCMWGENVDVPLLETQYLIYNNNQQMLNDTAGYTNTRILRDFQNNSNYASGVVDFAHGWYLPSSAQLRMIYGQLAFISSALVNAGGSDLASGSYWSSSENSSSKAWGVDFTMNVAHSGHFVATAKSSMWRVRAIRSFDYATEVHNTSMAYLWSTGDTTTSITVVPTQTTNFTVNVTKGDCTGTDEHTIVVNSPVTLTISDTACGNYTWIGTTYTESGSYTKTFTAANGCDSVVTLHLTVNQPEALINSVTACGSYTWIDGDGETYTQSGTYTYSHRDDNGCIQIDTLHLTIASALDVTVTTSTDTICDGDSVLMQANVATTSSIQVPVIAVGDILCTDNSIVKPSAWPVAGKTAMGIVFYVDNTGEHGWAMHLQNQATGVQWGGYGTDISSLTNYTQARNAILDLNGYTNTQRIRMAGGAGTYPAAYAVGFSSGWYLPSVGQLKVLYAEMPAVNASLLAIGSDPVPLNYGVWMFWSSTESGQTAAYAVDYFGHVNAIMKSATTYNVRSIRSF